MRILLTRLSSFGDVVHTWPLVEALGRLQPAPYLIWLVEEEYVPLVKTHPAVRCAVAVATRRWRRHPWRPLVLREVGAVLRALRRLRPDVALDPQGLLKSAVWGLLAGAQRRIGLHPDVRRERGAGLCYNEWAPSPGPGRHAVDVALSLLAALHAEVPWGAQPDGSFLRPDGGEPGPGSGPVVLVPGGGRPAKRWGVGPFAELARHFAHLGWEVEILWGPGEHQLAAAIAAAGGARLAPATPLATLPRYLTAARGVVGGDTGPVHLAAALGVPTVMVHLATDPQRWGARGPRVVVLDGRPGTEINPAVVAAAAATAFSRSSENSREMMGWSAGE